MPDFDNADLTEVPTPSSDDALMFDLSGYTIGWRPSGLALRRASDHGMEVGEILVDLQELFAADIDEEDLEGLDEEEAQELIEERAELDTGVSDFVAIVSKLIWLGALHFESSVKREAIEAIIDLEEMGEVPVDEMLGRVFPALEEMEEDGEGK